MSGFAGLFRQKKLKLVLIMSFVLLPSLKKVAGAPAVGWDASTEKTKKLVRQLKEY